MLPEPVCTGSKIYTMYNRHFITASFGHHSPGKQFLPADMTAADEVRPVKMSQS